MSLINFPIIYVPDPTKGKPLFYGQIYVGEPDLDPTVEINQKQLNIVQEDGTVVPVSQPFILSVGGVPVYNGATVRLDVEGNYSLKILDKSGAQTQYYIDNVYEGEPVTVETLPDLLISDLSQAYIFDTVAEYKAFTKTFPTGKIIYITERAIDFTVIAGTAGADDITLISNTNTSQSIDINPVNGVITMQNVGCVPDGTTSGGTDASVAVNAGFQYCRDNPDKAQSFIGSVGSYSLERPIKYLQGVNFFSKTTLSGGAGGTEFICNFSVGTIATPPTDNYSGERYNPTLDYTPMIYNTQLLTQEVFGGFRWNGNNKDVYGVYFNDWFYMTWLPMFFVSINKRPVTGLVGQFNNINLLTCNANKGGLLFVGQDTLNIRGLDTEGNLITGGSQLDIIADVSTKNSVTINEWHFEESSTNYPDIFARISGRGVEINGSSFGTAGANPDRYIELIGTGDSYTFDSETITPIAAINTNIPRHSTSVDNCKFQFNLGVVGSYVRAASVSGLVDNSGNTTNLVESFTAARKASRGFEVLQSDLASKLLHFTDDSTVNFYNNNNRYLQAAGADWLMENLAGNLNYTASGNINNTAVDIVNIISGNYRIAGLPTSAPVATNSLWNDSGTIKIT